MPIKSTGESGWRTGLTIRCRIMKIRPTIETVSCRSPNRGRADRSCDGWLLHPLPISKASAAPVCQSCEVPPDSGPDLRVERVDLRCETKEDLNALHGTVSSPHLCPVRSTGH